MVDRVFVERTLTEYAKILLKEPANGRHLLPVGKVQAENWLKEKNKSMSQNLKQGRHSEEAAAIAQDVVNLLTPPRMQVNNTAQNHKYTAANVAPIPSLRWTIGKCLRCLVVTTAASVVSSLVKARTCTCTATVLWTPHQRNKNVRKEKNSDYFEHSCTRRTWTTKRSMQ
jgi:hypothetical protein